MTASHLPVTNAIPVAATEAVTEPGAYAGCAVSKETEELVRELMVRFGDKWSLRVMDELYERGAMRFSRLRAQLEGVSQKMLTQTLRQLERDGVIVRQVYAEVPPRVDYALTKAGMELTEALCGVWEWAMQYGETVAAARAAFDAQQPRKSDPGSRAMHNGARPG
ncbi:MAG TPA: helix-turn-helix domain-containing protein [Ferrovibrio sp.]|uniref:winged helix-turn-helix transcriptional regulator n=1 Tax=Ferrovibrio sp. TaxID=1917215 RepID=UPI002ED3BE71